MARKAINHDNLRVRNELDKISLTVLCSEAKTVMRKLIQDSTFLGINRVPEEDVYYIVQNAPEISEESVLLYLKNYRQIKGKDYPKGKSSAEKYKRICTEVSKAFEEILNDGTTMNGLRKYVKKNPLTEDQVKAVQALLEQGVDAQSVIDLLAKMK
ncbi:TPA: hypothetical protein ME558_004832 [Klebsiella pneumoniae]|uniref:hypothetical protein n=1 Tax=Klebsiella TaxID=570 RepID=UPI0016437CFD|nr:hypothetical protein [Klebsiella michiganensis]EKU5337859.1 hypothetical protein [Klebsiella pneumoniae]EKV4190674.1 hypothetical protein [Klebsiella michiganensis]EKX2446642.1 hypothetical protein [Klebsiella pneumoniae]EKX8270877.1 hypothetical protein [Klebsiella pneumoniae]EKX9363768.1 hypothetical protein [Klebsiella pneumoniae]